MFRLFLLLLAALLGSPVACNSVVEVENAAPRVTFFAAAPAADGVVELTVWISDQEGDPVDLEVFYAIGGGDDETPIWAPGGHGTSGLTTEDARFEPEGQAHLLTWDVSDLDISQSVTFTFSPDDLIDAGATVTTPSFVPADGLSEVVGL